MGYFVKNPKLLPHGTKSWEVLEPFTYFRTTLKDKMGLGIHPDEYTDEQKRLRTIEVIEVPAGFRTDLATIPRIFWSIWPPHRPKYLKPAIIHDYMYIHAIGSKEEADLVFKEALEAAGVNKIETWLFYLGAKLVGRGNYPKK